MLVTEGVGETHLKYCKASGTRQKTVKSPSKVTFRESSQTSLTPTCSASTLKTSTAIMMNNNGFNNKKSLSEQINEVVNAKMSRRDKIEALIKLGIRENEVSFVLPTMPRVPSTPRFIFTFGVEIECVMPREQFENVANRDGVNYEFETYNHRDNREYFKFTTDASISRTSGMVGDPIECVSPILDGNKSGFDKLEACCKALNEAGAYVNRSTGLHVHIGASGMSGEQYVNVFKNYKMLQNVISSFLAPSRRDAYYCRPIDDHDFNCCHNASDVYREMDNDRYHSVNPKAYFAHGTIEFRQHQGSTNFKKIKMWVTFVSKLVAYSMNNVIENEITSIAEIPFLNATEKRYFENRKAEVNRTREVA